MRKPSKITGEDWSGQRVSYTSHQGATPEHGTVQRMANGKSPCAFVLFDGDSSAKLCYTKDLEKLK